MFHDIAHEYNCGGLALEKPDMRDCTCGKIIDCLLAERANLQQRVDKYETAYQQISFRPNVRSVSE